VAGFIPAGFDLMDVQGEVEIERFDPLRRRACFRLDWEDDEPAESLPEPAGA
jgi:hypothetical protein